MKNEAELKKIMKSARKDILLTKNKLKRKAKKSGDWVSYGIVLHTYLIAKVEKTKGVIYQNDKKVPGFTKGGIFISGDKNDMEYIIPKGLRLSQSFRCSFDAFGLSDQIL